MKKQMRKGGHEVETKFSVHYFFIKLTSRKLWVWLLSSLFVREILIVNGDHAYFYPLIIIWGIISIIYLVGEPLERGIGVMFENAKLTAELKAGAQANINKAWVIDKKNGGANE
jgi:hypothetical protein